MTSTAPAPRGERAARPATAGLAVVPGTTRRLVLGATGLAALSGLGLHLSGSVEAAYGGPTRSGAARRAVDEQSVSWVATASPRVALTFDDGPDPAFTPAVLDHLARHRARATFFVVGANVVAHPELAERIVAEGHTLANHTFDHAPLESLDEATVRDQLRRGRAAIAHLEHGPRIMRPPRGYTSPLVAKVAAQLGEREVFWTSCLENVSGPHDRERGASLAARSERGDVILCHDGGHVRGRWAQSYDRTSTVDALDALLGELAAHGLSAVSLPELLLPRPA